MNYVDRAHRPTLSTRRPGVERIIDSLPMEVADRDGLRAFTLWLQGEVSTWEILKAQTGGLNRLSRHREGGR